MKKTNFLLLFFLLLILSSSLYAIDTWDDFESHRWIPESFGGELPTITYDSIRFSNQTVIRLAFSGTGAYGFIRTNFFSNENWSNVSVVQADLYYEDSFSSNTNNPTSKFEAKNPVDVSYEFLVQYLTKNTWQTVNWPLRSQVSTASYATVSRIFLNIESFLGYAAMTAYFDNFRLVFYDGHTELWEDFNNGSRGYNYGGSFDTSKFSPLTNPPDVISHTHASPENPAGAGYLSWSWSSAQPTYAEIAAVGLNGGLGEDWSPYSTVRYDIYTSNTTARYKIFMWDGNSGFAPLSQIVNSPNNWTRLQFDISSGAIYSQNTSFNRSHITEFKCVVEYLDVPGANSGEAYFDNIVRYQTGPTFVEPWLRFEY